MFATLLRDLGVEAVTARPLIPGAAARPHVHPSPAVSADRDAGGQHWNGRIGIKRLIEALVRPQRGEGPVGRLCAIARRVDEIVVIAAEAEDSGRAERISKSSRIRIAVTLASPVGDKDRRSGGVRDADWRAENLRAAGDGELVAHVIVDAIGKILI